MPWVVDPCAHPLEHNGPVIGRRLQAVVLDIDDTLVDTRAAFAVAIKAVLDQWLPGLDPGASAAALAHWVADRHGHFRAYTRGELDFAEQRRLRAADLHAAFGGPVLDDAGFARWDAAYGEAFRGAWRLFDEVLPVLDRLDAAGLRYGTLTNAGTAFQRDKLRRVGLAERIEVLVGVDALGVGKPDPRVFRLVCAQLGVDPATALYVGDELDVDAQGARQAGLAGVWLDRRGARGPLGELGVPVVSSLTELADRLGV